MDYSEEEKGKIEKYWKEIKDKYAGKNIVVISELGPLDFRPKAYKALVNKGKMTYDEYLEVMKNSLDKVRMSFEQCYYESGEFGEFTGKISSINTKNNTLCFERICVSGLRMDGSSFFGRETHVWMSIKGFEKFKEGDCVSFTAEVYRYVKTNDGKSLDFGLRNPKNITRVEAYNVPSDRDLLEQEINQMVCGMCLYERQCYGFCIANEAARKGIHDQLLKIHDLCKEGCTKEEYQKELFRLAILQDMF